LKYPRAELSIGMLIAALLGLGLYSSLQVTLDQQRVAYQLPKPEPVLNARGGAMQSEHTSARRVTRFVANELESEPLEVETDPTMRDDDGDGWLDLMPPECLATHMPDYSAPEWQAVCESLHDGWKSKAECEAFLTASWHLCVPNVHSSMRPAHCCEY
jgi:hypothetical protein